MSETSCSTTPAARFGRLRVGRAALTWLADLPGSCVGPLLARLPAPNPLDAHLLALQQALVRRQYLASGPPLPRHLEVLTDLLVATPDLRQLPVALRLLLK